MLKESELIGVISVYRKEVRPFTDKQIELVKNFAAQAVIAIENTRLLNELRQRTDALSESLDRQTAMSEVLGVISSSPTDLTPVFDTILANATRLCEGNLAALWRYDGEFLVGAAQYNASAAFVEHYMGTKLEPGRSGPARLAALECRTVHVADITAEPGFSPMVLQYERASHGAGRSAFAREGLGRRHRHMAPGGAALHGTANRAGTDLRGSGRHRYRERPSAERAARNFSSSRLRPRRC